MMIIIVNNNNNDDDDYNSNNNNNYNKYLFEQGKYEGNNSFIVTHYWTRTDYNSVIIIN